MLMVCRASFNPPNSSEICKKAHTVLDCCPSIPWNYLRALPCFLRPSPVKAGFSPNSSRLTCDESGAFLGAYPLCNPANCPGSCSGKIMQLSYIFVQTWRFLSWRSRLVCQYCISFIWNMLGVGSKVYTVYTSSTAQGGGGSFRNRKPIGEVGCCESRIAERIHWWTEKWLELCFLKLQWLPHPQLLDVVSVWCSAVVV